MPQPISKERVHDYRNHPRIKFIKHKLLGYIAEYFPTDSFGDVNDYKRFAYQMNRDGNLLWVSERTIKRRMKVGYGSGSHGALQAFKQRKKPILPDSAFSLDELEQAAAIMGDLPQQQRD